GADLAVDNHTRNRTITALRSPAERANALLKSTFRALRRIILCPKRIGHITAAALVILTMRRGHW
ncbi:MAG: transposase family protein, partial [Angustibacter sp.]